MLVLESGDRTRTASADALDEIVNVGRPRNPDQWGVRNRVLGGSSFTWGGRCAPFDEIDFEARDWIPASGWPIGAADLDPYLNRSATHLGLSVGTGFSGDGFWRTANRSHPQESFDATQVLPFFWQFSRDPRESYRFEYVRFGRHLPDAVGPNVMVLTGATVQKVLTGPAGDRVEGVEIADPGGGRHLVAARVVVLATGGIENARLLLSSNDVARRGLGNDRDQVGRYLMDHLRGPVATFELAGTERLQKRFGRYNVDGRLFRAGFRLAPQMQRDEHLLNCAAWLGEEVAADDPWNALMRVTLGRARRADVGHLVRNRALLARGIRDFVVERNGVPRRFDGLHLLAMVEQRPDPDSRVTLSDRRDRFGSRLPRVDWRSHPDEARTMIRMAEVVADGLAANGFPRPELADWVRDRAPMPADFLDVAHPTATTRMSIDPADGVVDPDCRVHGVDGLHVAGSSVFPTAGHCNPTQTIVALAIRLADHLRERVAHRESVTVGSGPQVLLTGATGRIGRVALERLVERGYRVRATTSRDTTDLPDHGGAVGWRRVDLRAAGAAEFDALVAGCRHVVHLAAEIGKADRMEAVNVAATRGLAAAAERAGTTAFCYASTVAVYGSAVRAVSDEDGPVLTPDRDVPAEYWALGYVRAYGRTKLAGEHAVRDVAGRVAYTVLRPTVVVDTGQLLDTARWSRFKRTVTAHRRTHHVYVEDVVDAAIWAVERAATAGRVEVFNVSDEVGESDTYAMFFRDAYRATRDRRFRIVPVPGVVDWFRDVARFRVSPHRRPLWRMSFPADRLRAAGFVPRYGMRYAQQAALRPAAPTGSPLIPPHRRSPEDSARDLTRARGASAASG
ncbi:GMC oxidoreductase [Pseudonocardia alni]|uniref:GMC oxidoreductase n=1 Tax=Pseudonocardia alni TaxID=33907 RepID=UPI003870A012